MSDQAAREAEIKRASAPQHLGDGAYVEFDGYQLWLAANDHRNRVIALEPAVLRALIEYARRINKACGEPRFRV